MSGSAVNVPGANPAGSNTYLQFNNAGVFGGTAGATTDGTNITSLNIKPASFGMLGSTSGTLTVSAPATITSHTIIFPAAIGTANQVLTISNAGTGQLAWSNIALTGITTSLNTASPNNTVNASQILASGGSTNQDLVLSPKGTGAIIVDLPDSTTTGGNKRGSSAVDLQIDRNANTLVASGSNSFVVGSGNTASGNLSFAAGSGNAASAYGSLVIASVNSTASALSSCVIGGYWANSPNVRQVSFGGSVDATSQTSVMSVSNNTTDATQTELFCDGSGATSRMVIPTGKVWVFSILIGGNETGGDVAGYKVEGVISNVGGAVALVGAITKTVLAETDAAWDVDVVADDANNALVVNVTGAAATNIKWGASVFLSEMG